MGIASILEKVRWMLPPWLRPKVPRGLVELLEAGVDRGVYDVDGVLVVVNDDAASALSGCTLGVKQGGGHRFIGPCGDDKPLRIAVYDSASRACLLAVEPSVAAPGSTLILYHSGSRCTMCRRGGGCDTRCEYTGGGGKCLADVVAGIGIDVARDIAKAMGVYGLEPRRAAWRIAEWMERNMKYDAGMAGRLIAPSDIVRLRRGVCTHYALLAAAALAGVGGTPLIMLLDEPQHAAAGLVWNNNVYIVDQMPPVISLHDYLEYATGPVRATILLPIPTSGDSSAVVAWSTRLEAGTVPDDYPQDTVPEAVVLEAARRAAERLNVRLSRSATIGSWGEYCVTLPVPGRKAAIPLDAAYTPVYRDEWIEHLADRITLLYTRLGRGSRLWAEVRRGSQGMCLRVYSA